MKVGMACESSSLVWSLILNFFKLSFLLSYYLSLYLCHSWFVFLCRRESDTSDHEGNIRKCIRPNKYTLLESITVSYNIVEIIKFLSSPHYFSSSISLSHFLVALVKLSHWFTSCPSFPFLCVCLSISISIYLSLSCLPLISWSILFPLFQMLLLLLQMSADVQSRSRYIRERTFREISKVSYILNTTLHQFFLAIIRVLPCSK